MEIPRIWCFLLLFAPILTAQGPGSYIAGREAGIDLAGNWGPVFHEDAGERGPGPELVNYLGFPINEGARLAALSYDASRFTVPEHQCEPHIVSYIYRPAECQNLGREIRKRKSSSPSSSTSTITSSREPSGWTAARILAMPRCTPGWVFPRESGMAAS